jgi:hypothetical protein
MVVVGAGRHWPDGPFVDADAVSVKVTNIMQMAVSFSRVELWFFIRSSLGSVV